MQQAFPATNSKGGYATFMVILLGVIVGIVFSASFFEGLAQYESSRSLDRYHQLRLEKNAISNLITENIYEYAGTRATREPWNSADFIQALQTKLDDFSGGGAISYGSSAGAGQSITVTGIYANRSAAELNQSYPSASPVAQPTNAANKNSAHSAYIDNFRRDGSTPVPYDPTWGGSPALGNGQLAFSIPRLGTDGQIRTLTFEASILLVPTTDYDIIGYGMPSYGVAGIPDVPPGGLDVDNIGGRAAIATEPDPTGDFYESGVNSLPYAYRADTAFAWDAFEYIWDPDYRSRFQSDPTDGAGFLHMEDTDGNPTTFFSFGVAQAMEEAIVEALTNAERPTPRPAVPDGFPAPPPMATYLPTGIDDANWQGYLTYLEPDAADDALRELVINVADITDPIVVIADDQNIGTVVVEGSPVVDSDPFVLWVQNSTPSGPRRTRVRFEGNNYRPFVFFGTEPEVTFENVTDEWRGAFFFGPGTEIIKPSSVEIFGTVAFFAGEGLRSGAPAPEFFPTPPSLSWDVAMIDNTIEQDVRSILEGIVPRVLIADVKPSN